LKRKSFPPKARFRKRRRLLLKLSRRKKKSNQCITFCEDLGGSLKLIVGLGNPGKKYQFNRHNVGFMVVDRFAEEYDIDLCIKKKKAVFGRGFLNGEEVVVLKPQTFMNLSGEAVLYLASFLKVKTTDIVVVADDTELPFGKVRIRRNGGSGGHNGIKSLIYSLKSENFPRIRFGIGRPNGTSEQELCNYVLEDFSSDEMKSFQNESKKVVQALYVMMTESLETAMNKFSNK
jgi:PTH1 family peptidyl-tRNA hydrolase